MTELVYFRRSFIDLESGKAKIDVAFAGQHHFHNHMVNDMECYKPGNYRKHLEEVDMLYHLEMLGQSLYRRIVAQQHGLRYVDDVDITDQPKIVLDQPFPQLAWARR